jgi:hypothetical protein
LRLPGDELAPAPQWTYTHALRANDVPQRRAGTLIERDAAAPRCSRSALAKQAPRPTPTVEPRAKGSATPVALPLLFCLRT